MRRGFFPRYYLWNRRGIAVAIGPESGRGDFDLVPMDVKGLDPAQLNLEGERAGYRYQDTRFSGRLRLSRKDS